MACGIFMSPLRLLHILTIGEADLPETTKEKTKKVEIVILTAFGVGGATVLGAVIGLIFKRTTKSFNDAALSMAAGVMLAAAMLGLILPSLEYGGSYGIVTTVIGIFAGAVSINLLDKLVLRCFDKRILASRGSYDRLRQVTLFVMAIAIHNLPEGIAAGVGFGGGNMADGIFIATAIALQNIPEGMAVIVTMLDVGIGSGRTFLIAALTGVVEIVGTFIGYFAVNISLAVLPFVLAFAGGNMLYVIAEEMIPSTHSEDTARSTYFVLGGFCLMLLFSVIL